MTCDTAAQLSCLHSYATHFWAPHCEDAASERERVPLQILLEEFLSNMAPQSPFNAWNQYGFQPTIPGVDLYAKLRQSQKSKPCSLYVSCIFNFGEVVKSRIQREPDLEILQDCANLSVSYGAPETLMLFLDLKEFKVTEDVVRAAAGNSRYGNQMMALLFKKSTQDNVGHESRSILLSFQYPTHYQADINLPTLCSGNADRTGHRLGIRNRDQLHD
ncbi:hypothetical protein GGS24DRAFT_174081 [Hypoxylon argillaceum]|nr:hypothetical protein GGS24DRAFT_174081 [Hypoxylon argillaceum]